MSSPRGHKKKHKKDKKKSRKVKKLGKPYYEEAKVSEKEYDSSKEDMDLGKELHPISYYINDRVEMVNQMFSVINGKKFQAMLPPVLKDLGTSDLKQMCVDQLLGMSAERILCTLEGREMDSSSEMDELEDCYSEDDQPKNKKQHGKSSPPRHKRIRLSRSDDSESEPRTGQNLDILELELRKKLIESMLQQQTLVECTDDNMCDNKIDCKSCSSEVSTECRVEDKICDNSSDTQKRKSASHQNAAKSKCAATASNAATGRIQIAVDPQELFGLVIPQDIQFVPRESVRAVLSEEENQQLSEYTSDREEGECTSEEDLQLRKKAKVLEELNCKQKLIKTKNDASDNPSELAPDTNVRSMSKERSASNTSTATHKNSTSDRRYNLKCSVNERDCSGCAPEKSMKLDDRSLKKKRVGKHKEKSAGDSSKNGDDACSNVGVLCSSGNRKPSEKRFLKCASHCFKREKSCVVKNIKKSVSMINSNPCLSCSNENNRVFQHILHERQAKSEERTKAPSASLISNSALGAASDESQLEVERKELMIMDMQEDTDSDASVQLNWFQRWLLTSRLRRLCGESKLVTKMREKFKTVKDKGTSEPQPSTSSTVPIIEGSVAEYNMLCKQERKEAH